jgi:hypothetical protein
VTENTWIRCADPDKMLEYLQGKISQRQMWLFGCACCRRIWSKLSDIGRNLIEATETLADGGMGHRKYRRIWDEAFQAEAALITPQFVILISQLKRIMRRVKKLDKRLENEEISIEEYKKLWFKDYEDAGAVSGQDPSYPSTVAQQMASDAVRTVYWAKPFVDSRLLDCTPWAMAVRAHWYDAEDNLDRVEASEKRHQARVLRDILGNPFHAKVLRRSWLKAKVVHLASDIYHERAFDRMPALADALEVAGCDNEEILVHCRGRVPHAKGCFVLDLLLGKE